VDAGGNRLEAECGAERLERSPGHTLPGEVVDIAWRIRVTVTASRPAPRTSTSQVNGSSGIASRCSQRARTAAALFDPHPGSPGYPSALSPTRAR
jgi:hypothetical protein